MRGDQLDQNPDSALVWDLQRQPRAFRSEGSWTGPRASSSSSPVLLLLLLAPLADSWRLKGGFRHK